MPRPAGNKGISAEDRHQPKKRLAKIVGSAYHFFLVEAGRGSEAPRLPAPRPLSCSSTSKKAGLRQRTPESQVPNPSKSSSQCLIRTEKLEIQNYFWLGLFFFNPSPVRQHLCTLSWLGLCLTLQLCGFDWADRLPRGRFLFFWNPGKSQAMRILGSKEVLHAMLAKESLICFLCSPTAGSFGVSAQIGSGVVRGSLEVRFHEGSTMRKGCGVVRGGLR